MGESWIKLFRKFLDWEWFHDDAMVKMWLYLLLMANYEDRKWQGGVVRRGELVTSVPTLMRDLNRTKQQIRTSLLRLVNTKEITLKSTHHYTIITICKYDSYQEFDFGFQPAEQHTDNTPITHKQHSNNTTIRNKESKNIKESSKEASSSAGADPALEIDFKAIVDFFNKSVAENGSVFPKIKGATGKRVGYIKARVREYGLEAIYEVITKATQSDFMNGKNQRGWVASFDWIFLPTNFPKVLEGNYDNRTITNQQNNGATNTNRNGSYADQRQAEREQLARGVAATIARRLAEDDARAGKIRQP